MEEHDLSNLRKRGYRPSQRVLVTVERPWGPVYV